MISYRQLDQWLEQGKVAQLIDLREPRMYRHDRIRGSRNIPYGELGGSLALIRKECVVVFYCDRGVKSMLVCRDLHRRGYDAVDLAGGMLNYRGKYIDRSPVSAIE